MAIKPSNNKNKTSFIELIGGGSILFVAGPLLFLGLLLDIAKERMDLKAALICFGIVLMLAGAAMIIVGIVFINKINKKTLESFDRFNEEKKI